ncbi:hypothetical protein AVEN_220086-1, partial [Araneus ventricosus]
MASGQSASLRRIEESLSRALTSHGQYTSMIEVLDKLPETPAIIDLKRRAKERLVEYEIYIKGDHGKWLTHFTVDDVETNDKLDNGMDITDNTAIDCVNIVKENCISVNNVSVCSNYLQESAKTVKPNGTHVVQNTAYNDSSDYAKLTNVKPDENNSKTLGNLPNNMDNIGFLQVNPNGTHVAQRIENGKSCTFTNDYMDFSDNDETQSAFETDTDSEFIPGSGAGCSVATKPNTCVREQHLNDAYILDKISMSDYVKQSVAPAKKGKGRKNAKNKAEEKIKKGNKVNKAKPKISGTEHNKSKILQNYDFKKVNDKVDDFITINRKRNRQNSSEEPKPAKKSQIPPNQNELPTSNKFAPLAQASVEIENDNGTVPKNE